MELAFIWIQSFRSIENLNFNFSDEFDFFYDIEKNNLKRSPKNDISTKGFYGDKILNLTSLIGENGVGKTSLLNCIETIYSDLKNSFSFKKEARKLSSLNYIVVFKTTTDYYYFSNGLPSKLKTDLKHFPKTVGTLDDLFLIYYTNFFDYSPLDSSNHTYDLSTNSLVNYVFSSLINKGEESEDYSLLSTFPYTYKTREIVSQLEFISDFDKHIPFNIPSRLSVAIRYEVQKDAYLHGEGKVMYENKVVDDYPEEKPTKEESNYDKAIEILTKLLLRLEEGVSNQNIKNPTSLIFKSLIQQAILINYFEDVVFEKNIVVDYHLLGFDLSKIISSQKITKTKETDDLFLYALEKVSDYRGIILDAKGLLIWINEFVELTVSGNEFIPEKGLLNMNLHEANTSKFKKLIRQFAEFPFSPFLDFYWSGISSGENALITIFSRIYYLRNNINKETATIIYMLDECEINLHPEWQRRFIKLLTTLLPEMLPKSKHQLIISSHSPLMLSDIPKSNVIFLERKESKIVVSHLSERKQTFAANIHTLLSDAFFMKEGTLGEVAKDKINWVIDQLNSRYAVFEQNLEEIKKIVDLIGEPVIRTKLATMVNEKLEINLYNIDTRLKDLERKRKK